MRLVHVLYYHAALPVMRANADEGCSRIEVGAAYILKV